MICSLPIDVDKPAPKSRLLRFSYVFFRSFIVLALSFISMIYVEFFFFFSEVRLESLFVAHD
jgi:hypothetical protein